MARRIILERESRQRQAIEKTPAKPKVAAVVEDQEQVSAEPTAPPLEQPPTEDSGLDGDDMDDFERRLRRLGGK